MKPGDIVYILLGYEVHDVIYVRDRMAPHNEHKVIRVIRWNRPGAGETSFYGEMFASKEDAERQLFLRRLADT